MTTDPVPTTPVPTSLTDPGARLLADPDLYSGDRFAGLPVEQVGETVPLSPELVAWYVTDSVEPGERGESALPGELDALLDRVGPERVRALAVSGCSVSHAPEILARYADRLPALRAVFLGFTPTEQWEISWIGHGDITPVLEAYPLLERLEMWLGTPAYFADNTIGDPGVTLDLTRPPGAHDQPYIAEWQ